MTVRGFSTDTMRDLVPWSCVSLIVLASLLLGSPLAGLGLWPWLVSILLFGLPHGACDHLVAMKISGNLRTKLTILSFFLLYLAAGIAVVVLWIVSPTAALVLFLGLTIWHWGSADAVAYKEGSTTFALRSVGRGLLVIAAPLAFHPEEGWNALSNLLSIFEPDTAASMPIRLPELATGCLLGAIILGGLLGARDLWCSEPSRAVREGIETGLLLALFYLVSPVAAVGVYFVFWHAWRHTLRTGALLDPKMARDWRTLVASYHSRALPLTLASVVALLALTLVFAGLSPQKLPFVYLVLLSALTVPHSVVVLAWDYRARRDHLVRPHR